MQSPDDVPMTDAKAEAVLRALADPLDWVANKEAYSELAHRTEEYTGRSSTGHEYFVWRETSHLYDRENPFSACHDHAIWQGFSSLEAVKAACERHHLLGEWEWIWMEKEEEAKALRLGLIFHQWEQVYPEEPFGGPCYWQYTDGTNIFYAVAARYPEPGTFARIKYAIYQADEPSKDETSQTYVSYDEATRACERHHATGKWE